MPRKIYQEKFTLAQFKDWLQGLKEDQWLTPGFEAPRGRRSAVQSILLHTAAPMTVKEALVEVALILGTEFYMPGDGRRFVADEYTELWLEVDRVQIPLTDAEFVVRKEETITVFARAEEIRKHRDLNHGWQPVAMGEPNLIKCDFNESNRTQALRLHHGLRRRHLTSHIKDVRT